MRILITGITGSFGTEFSRQFADKHEIHGVSRSEVLQFQFPFKDKVHLHKGNVVDDSRMFDLISEIHPEWIIHAAAYKHVATGGHDMWEMHENNVNGTRGVVLAARRCGILKVTLISTDKAVEPTTFYGKTKAVSEGLVLEAGGNVIRYGNVFGSSGSIVPVFLKTLLEGEKPVLHLRCNPITNEGPTRFFLPIEEAIGYVAALAPQHHKDGSVSIWPCGVFIPRDLKACFVTTVAAACIAAVNRGSWEVSGSLLYGEKTHEILVDHMERHKCEPVDRNGIHFWYIPASSSILTQPSVEVHSYKPEGGMFTVAELTAMVAKVREKLGR